MSGQIIPINAQKAPQVFNRPIVQLDYVVISKIRSEVADFLQQNYAAAEYAGIINLTLSEILTNLVKHPSQKATLTTINMSIEGETLITTVSDDSTPFLEFEEKCQASLFLLNAGTRLAESGYGLGCILTQHTDIHYTPATLSPDGLNHFVIRDGLFRRNANIATHSLQKKIAFLVDDDPIALKIETRLLQPEYTVHPFSKAEDALQAFHTCKPDIVISDLNMPEMDGRELRKELLNHTTGSTVPFIFLSAEHGSRNDKYIHELGIDDFLCKPVSKDQLLSVVGRLIRRSEQVRAAIQGQVDEEISDVLKPNLPPHWRHWHFETRSRSAEVGGGDFILHKETPHSMNILLADVMGHGRKAKFFAYTYAGYLHSLFRTSAENADAASFLNKLSSSIEGDPILENIIITCQSIELLDNGGISIASAGHPSPFLASKTVCRKLAIAGPLPALVEQINYECKHIPLKSGTRILFGTDGFFESFAISTAVIELLQSVQSLPLTEATEKIWTAFLQKDNKAPHHKDDATMFIAEYRG